MNQVTLLGRLTNDPELRYTQNQTAVVRFSLAVRRDYGKAEQENVDFFRCVCFQKTAEFMEQYFSKGDRIAVMGKLQNNPVEINEKKVNLTNIIAERIYFADGKRNKTAEQTDGFMPVGSDDLPF